MILYDNDNKLISISTNNNKMQDTQVDLNAQIRLMKRPSPTYPAS